MKKKLKSNSPSNAAACSPSLEAMETLVAWKKFEKNSGIVAFLKHAIRMERERDHWRNEHDRILREFQHRLTVLATSAIEATHYPENAIGEARADNAASPHQKGN